MTALHAAPPWRQPDKQRHRLVNRAPWEWLPRPHAGRIMVPKRKESADAPIYVQVVPGPGGFWQLVRVELATPVARGFKTAEDARAWVARAIQQGVLPQNVVVVEPPVSSA